MSSDLYTWAKAINEFDREYVRTHVVKCHFQRQDGAFFDVRAVPSPYHPTFFCFIDEKDIRELWWNIQKGDVIFDIGASYGSYTLPALAMGAGYVYAWSPEEARPMRYNVWDNGFEDRCTVFDEGVWSKRGILALRDGKNPIVFCETRDEAVDIIEKHPGAGTMLSVRAIDAIAPTLRLDRLDWIKLDVEGAEVECLKGGVNTIAKFKPKILVENHVFKDPDIQQKCWDILKDIGYTSYQTRPYHAVSHSLYLP